MTDRGKSCIKNVICSVLLGSIVCLAGFKNIGKSIYRVNHCRLLPVRLTKHLFILDPDCFWQAGTTSALVMNFFVFPLTQHESLTLNVIGCLTGLVGGDGHGHSLLRPGALRRHSIHRPHLEGIVGVGLQLIDGHPGSLQAQLLGAEVDAVTTGLTAPAVGPAAFTHDIVCQVLASSGAPGWTPLQVHGGLIHIGDEVDRRRRRAWRGGRRSCCYYWKQLEAEMLSKFRVMLIFSAVTVEKWGRKRTMKDFKKSINVIFIISFWWILWKKSLMDEVIHFFLYIHITKKQMCNWLGPPFIESFLNSLLMSCPLQPGRIQFHLS